MPEERTPDEDRLVALHEAGHVVVSAAVAGIPEEVTVEPGTGSNQGRTAATVHILDVESELLVRTAGAAAESLRGPERRRRLHMFLRTVPGRQCWSEIRWEINYLTRPTEPFEGKTFPPSCEDRDEAVDLVRIAFRKSRGLLEECEGLLLAVADRLQEERTLSEEELRDILPDDPWQEPGARVKKELHDERERLASDAA